MPDDKKPRKQRNHPDVVLAHAQIWLTAILLLAIIALLFAMVFFRNQMSDRVFSIVASVFTALVTLLTLSWNYFFARQRPNSLPDQPPNNTGGNHAPLSTGGTVAVSNDDAGSGRLAGPG